MPLPPLDITITGTLIVYLEDDKLIGSIIKSDLVSMGFQVDWFDNGLDCLRAIKRKRYDICVLDWLVPEVSGHDVMRSIKMNSKVNDLPIIFTTSRDHEDDIINTLEAGADDYIVKPIQSSVLAARIKSLLRRSGYTAPHEIKTWSNLRVNFTVGQIYYNNMLVNLTILENSLALLFFKNLNQLVTRSHILHVVWGHNCDVETRKIDVAISSLRKKLFISQSKEWELSSTYGLGYKLKYRPSQPLVRSP